MGERSKTRRGDGLRIASARGMNIDRDLVGARSGPRFGRTVAAMALTTLASFALPETSRAEAPPSISGFSAIGQVSVDKTGCASCPAVFATSRRHRTFALASDSPFPMSPSGRFDVVCRDGSEYHVFLNSSPRGGPFQVIPNTCSNLDSKEIKISVTSVLLSPADQDRSVAIIAYGSF